MPYYGREACVPLRPQCPYTGGPAICSRELYILLPCRIGPWDKCKCQRKQHPGHPVWGLRVRLATYLKNPRTENMSIAKWIRQRELLNSCDICSVPSAIEIVDRLFHNIYQCRHCLYFVRQNLLFPGIKPYYWTTCRFNWSDYWTSWRFLWYNQERLKVQASGVCPPCDRPCSSVNPPLDHSQLQKLQEDLEKPIIWRTFCSRK